MDDNLSSHSKIISEIASTVTKDRLVISFILRYFCEVLYYFVKNDFSFLTKLLLTADFNVYETSRPSSSYTVICDIINCYRIIDSTIIYFVIYMSLSYERNFYFLFN